MPFLDTRARAAYHKKWWRAKIKENPLYDRWRRLRRKYNLSLEQFTAMFKRQGERCAICRTPPARGIPLHVDHCHRTQRVRALLCSSCNRGLGCFRDDPHLLRRAIIYLKKHA